MKKLNIILLLLFLTSFFGYLEWGERQEFIFQMEFDVLKKIFTNPASVVHPFIVLPLLGQIILLIALLRKQTNKYLILLGIFGIFLLYAMIFIVGILSMKFKIMFSVLPFFILALIWLKTHFLRKNLNPS